VCCGLGRAPCEIDIPVVDAPVVDQLMIAVKDCDLGSNLRVPQLETSAMVQDRAAPVGDIRSLADTFESPAANRSCRDISAENWPRSRILPADLLNDRRSVAAWKPDNRGRRNTSTTILLESAASGIDL